MPPLVIVGADGFACQVAQWVRDINAVQPTWELAGFLTGPSGDRLAAAGPLLGHFKDYLPREEEFFVCALAGPQDKKVAVAALKAKGARFVPIIHPTACVCKSSHYGEGVVFFPNSNISAYSRAGNFVTIIYSGLGHDASAGDYSTISANCELAGGVKLGRGVLVGTGAIIIPRLEVGDGSVVEPGSIVIKNVRPNCVVSGNPARKKTEGWPKGGEINWR